ncbi:MAG: DUF2188 domain-containing protein [Acidimicrobiales bacterium]
MAEPAQPDKGMLPNVVVEKQGGRWAVRREATSPAINTHLSKEEALAAGRQIAEQGGVELIVMDESGDVESRASYQWVAPEKG